MNNYWINGKGISHLTSKKKIARKRNVYTVVSLAKDPATTYLHTFDCKGILCLFQSFTRSFFFLETAIRIIVPAYQNLVSSIEKSLPTSLLYRSWCERNLSRHETYKPRRKSYKSTLGQWNCVLTPSVSPLSSVVSYPSNAKSTQGSKGDRSPQFVRKDGELCLFLPCIPKAIHRHEQTHSLRLEQHAVGCFQPTAPYGSK